ncbi:MAG TPA: cation:proton antiporter [bacterium]|nr:cation:proton antiporter [bacterium]HEX68537.1 cation:proton antiporter [bacterium]
MEFILCFFLLMVGLYAVVTKRNLVKIIIGLAIMEYAINLFLILIGYRKDGIAPIMTSTMDRTEFLRKAVDPLPQALVVTSIVIGFGILALAVSIAIRIYERFGTFDINEIKKLKG